ncbi:MAG: NAD(P)-binding domain-containing protein, partial [Pseudolabrys sp.]
MLKIGFIGLGNMGGPMARNLLKAGHQVTGCDIVPAALEAHVAAGGQAAASATDAARDADVVVSMLPSGSHVRALFTGDAGLIAAVKSGTL